MSKAEAERSYIPLLASHYEAIRQMPREEGNEFLRAIADYGFSGIEPNFTGTMAIVWTAIFPILENNRKLSLSGGKGGKASKRNNPNGRRGKAATDTEKPDGSPEKEPESTANSEREAPPSLDDLKLYIDAYNLNVDAEEFYNYYSSRNWEINGEPIKSISALLRKWSEKANVRTWQQRESQKVAAPIPTQQDNRLGIGEWRDGQGRRRFSRNETIVPESAPPRPSNGHYWNDVSERWENTI